MTDTEAIAAAMTGLANADAEGHHDLIERLRALKYELTLNTHIAECTVLGRALVEGRLPPGKTRAFFTVKRHRLLWDAMTVLIQADGTFDLTTLVKHLQEVGHLETVGLNRVIGMGEYWPGPGRAVQS